MLVVAIRHGIAEPQDNGDLPDEVRSLTPRGKKRMQKAAAGLHRIVPDLERVATSPLTRAVQTAEIVTREYGLTAPATVAALAPGGAPEEVLAWLQDAWAKGPLALVGHEPDLSTWVSWVLTGGQGSILQLKKGAACLLEFPGTCAAGAATLLWSLTPRQLRQLAG